MPFGLQCAINRSCTNGPPTSRPMAGKMYTLPGKATSYIGPYAFTEGEHMSRTTIAVLITICATVTLFAQDPPTPSDAPPASQALTATSGPGRMTPPSQDPQPYEKVITKDAKTKKGIFLVHQVKDKYFYEIPKSEFGKEFLWNASIARTTMGVGYGHQQLAERVVYWERSGNRVHLRENNYEAVADAATPIAEAVKAANNSTIIMTFPVAAFAKDGAPVIEVRRLFTTDVPEISARQRLNATTMDASRSFIDRISPFPGNIEVEATMTYTRMQPPVGTTRPVV